MADDTTSGSSRRPTLSVATVGHYRHGKTTLTAAITRVLSQREPEVAPLSVAELDRRSGSLISDPSIWGRGWPRMHGETELPPHLTIRGSQIRYGTSRRVFVHVDCPGRRPWLKNAARCQALADALILVVSAPDSVQAQTREHLLLARGLGVRQVVVFLNKCDKVTELEWLDLAEQETRELLGRCGFDGDATPVIRGAALPALAGEAEWEASIHDLIEALTVHVAPPEPASEGEALLYVNQVFSMRSTGLVAQGRLRRGALRRGDALRLVGLRDELAVKVMDIEVFHQKVEVAEAGQFVGVNIHHTGRPVWRHDVLPGAALIAGEGRTTRRLDVRLELLATADEGRSRPIVDGHTASLLFGTTAISGTIRLPEPILLPGDACDAVLELIAPVYVEPGMAFVLRDGTQPRWKQGAPALWGGTAGSGRVLGVHPV